MQARRLGPIPTPSCDTPVETRAPGPLSAAVGPGGQFQPGCISSLLVDDRPLAPTEPLRIQGTQTPSKAVPADDSGRPAARRQSAETQVRIGRQMRHPFRPRGLLAGSPRATRLRRARFAMSPAYRSAHLSTAASLRFVKGLIAPAGSATLYPASVCRRRTRPGAIVSQLPKPPEE